MSFQRMAELRNPVEQITAGQDVYPRALQLPRDDVMTDQQTMLQAVSNAQRILEEYFEPKPHDDGAC